MLKKLIKYDLKDIYKILIIFYILAVFFAVLTRVFFEIQNSVILNVIAQICSGVTISMLFNILINNILRLWHRFKSNLYGDESYLTHTLPVKKSTLYNSKISAVVISLFTSVAVIVLSLFIAYYSKENIQVLKTLISSLGDFLEVSPVLFLICISFLLFLEFLSAVQCGFTGIILGYKRNRAKLGFSVLFGFIAYSITQAFVLLLVFVTSLFDNGINELFTSNQISDVSVFKNVIILTLAIYFVLAVIVYFINQKLFSKGVNIE